MNKLAPAEALNAWLLSPQGAHVLKSLAQELVCVDESLYGTNLLQLGLSSHMPCRAYLHFPGSWTVSSIETDPLPSLIASFHQLPFDSSSMDCILAPFTMEICESKKHCLDEIDRVLKPMGHVVFIGVNPWSLWGIALRMSAIKPCSAMYLQHAMTAHGYEQRMLNNCYFIPPLCFFSSNVEEKWIHRLEFLNEMGKMLWPCPAGFYCLVMQKFSSCVTPLVLPEVVCTSPFA